MYVTINPYNQEKLAKYSYLSNNELDLTLDKLTQTYTSWKQESIHTRRELGINLSKLLNNQKENLGYLITSEMGKPLKEAVSEIEKCITLVEYITNNFESFLKDDTIDYTTYINYSPTGAVLGIMPWNFPMWQVFRYAFPAIMGGNIALLKHAPNTFGCGEAIAKLFTEAGFPKNVFTNLIIDITQVEQVIAHPITQGICVTGSTNAGSAVACLAGKYLKKTVLELGGIDAAILLKDADFNTALTAIFKSRIFNAGQVCIAPKRIFIPQEKLEYTISFLKELISQITLGNPLDSKTIMGPIAKSDFLPVLENQVQRAITKGAQLIVGNKTTTPFFTPTLLIVNNENPILKEEIFGPVLCIVPYAKETNLITEINSTDYGLGTSIWSKNTNKAKEWATKIDVGFVAINKIVKSDVRYPFGGVKNSGYGKELGEEGFKTFLNAKTISL